MWSSRPFVRILLFFIVGILLSKYVPIIKSIDNIMIIIVATLALSAAFILTISSVSHKYNWFSGLTFGILIICTGIFISNKNIPDNRYNVNDDSTHSYLANVISSPTQTNQAVKVVAQVILIDSDSIGYNNQNVLCYIAKDSLSLQLKYGNLFTFKGKLTSPQGPQNPEEFDYKNYLEQNGIFSTVYIRPETWSLIGYEPNNYIVALGNRIRNSLLKNLSKNGVTGENYAVASAVLLGYDDTMEPELKNNYITAGAMHILCVSGLHVGIIYLVLSFLFRSLKNNRFNNILAAVIQLLIVWAYATITGLSPSVQRAALMISVFIIGKLTNRHRDTYNTLAISALLVLLINPNLIFNVGFQLSYSAVLGIITFHQPIYRLLYFSNSIIDSIWSITVLSFAAQLATFPIATYYFHFFPTWFWLSNLFTFPLSFLIIASGLLFVITFWIPVVSQLIGMAIAGLVYILNYIVNIVVELPFSGIENIHTSLPMAISLYMFIILMFFLINEKRHKLFIPATLVLTMIIGLITLHRYSVLTQEKVVIYSIRNQSKFELIDGQNQLIISDSSMAGNNQSDYQIKNTRSKWGLGNSTLQLPIADTVISDILYTIDDYIYFNDLTILVSNGNNVYYPTESRYPVDLLIISGKNYTNINNLTQALNIKRVVIDGSVPPWNRNKILTSCAMLELQCYDVVTNGALIINL